jgi:hypothetical protein
LLRTLSINSGFLPIIFFLLFLNRNKEKKLWVIFLYAVISLLTDYSYNIISRQNEFYIYSFFTIAEFTLYSIFLYYNLNTKLFKKLLLISYVLFFPVTIYNFFQKEFENFDSLTASVECILIILFSILFLYEQIKEPESIFIYTSKKFWIIVAFFLYLSSTLFLFMYADKLPTIEKSYYWSINFVFNILKNIFFTIAFLLRKNAFSDHPLMKNQYNY